MKKTYNTSEMEEFLNKAFSADNISDSEELRKRALYGELTAQKKRIYKSKPFRYILIASIIVIITSMTAFSEQVAQFADKIVKSLTTEKIIASTVEKHYAHDGSDVNTIIGFIEFDESEKETKELEYLINTELVKFQTIEEAEEVIGFNAETPDYIPQGYVFAYTSVTKYGDGSYAKTIRQLYEKTEENKKIGEYPEVYFVISKEYVGINTKISLESIENVETINIREIECVRYGNNILFIKEGYMYNILANYAADDIDTDELTKIIESMLK